MKLKENENLIIKNFNPWPSSPAKSALQPAGLHWARFAAANCPDFESISPDNEIFRFSVFSNFLPSVSVKSTPSKGPDS